MLLNNEIKRYVYIYTMYLLPHFDYLIAFKSIKNKFQTECGKKNCLLMNPNNVGNRCLYTNQFLEFLEVNGVGLLIKYI